MRGKVNWLKPDQIVTRAKSQIGAPILYHLEYPNGGTNPDSTSPAAQEGNVADCIGFAAWAGGFDRYCPTSWPDHSAFPEYDGYINTDSMVDDATGARKWFRTGPCPAPGMFIVAPTFRRKLPPFQRVIGHIGVITAVGLNVDDPTGIKVVHCSPSNYRYTDSRSAIYETDASIWFNYPNHYYVYLSLSRPVSAIMRV